QEKFGIREWMEDPKNADKLFEFLRFRLDFLEEEYKETVHAFASADPEELIDGHIDICVIAIGTLLAFGVDVEKALDVVHKANMAKEPGTKPERPNPLGLPDLMKPEGWENPSHNGNHGNLTDNI
ncbi:MAG: nucleoside triphosphate pyrophosphohydrolase family protein, partial [Nitrososphaerales archaeon]|nr:nucleoside triphosphate pyrophosphohydrolase family protein [Nitrososphaerales archaeon]